MCFELAETTTIDSVKFWNYATVAGNITVGIYAVASVDTVDTGSLIVQSASTAMAGASQLQTISFTATTLAPGQYFTAVEYSDTTATFAKVNIPPVSGVTWTRYFDQAYGVLPATCPATTAMTSLHWQMIHAV